MMGHRDRVGRRQAHPRRADRETRQHATRPTRGWLLLVFLVLATLAAYQPAWHGGFLWDDDGHVTRNELRSIDGLRRIWVELGATQQYYPLVHSAFWLQSALWGSNPLGYHVVNIILHALAAFLLAVILRRLAVPWPWLGAFVFALHPVHVESVAWITELKNTLSGVLFLASAWAYGRFDETRQTRRYALAATLFVLALLSKTVTAVLPALLLIVWWWQRGRVEWRRDVWPLAPFFVVAAGFGALTVWTEHTLIGARGSEFDVSLVERGLLAGRAIWFYAGKLVWPADLMFIYPRWSISAHQWRLYLYPLGLAGMLVALWMWRRRSRAPFAAALYFGVALFPAIGFFNVYPFRYSFVADHFQYLASIGLIALFTGSVATLLQRWERQWRWIPAAAAIVMLGPLALLTWSQSRDYADAETLYRATLRRNPSCWMAHNNLAVLLLPGSVDDAMAHIEQALTYHPDYPEAHNNRGLALQLLGRSEEAAAAHATALRLEPGFADAHNNLGTAWYKMGRLQAAAAQYREALRLRPDFFQARANLGDASLAMGNAPDAVSQYREALRISPGLATVHYNLATALERTGRREEAMAEYGKTLELEPGAADAHANLGGLLENMGRVVEAVRHYEAAARLQPGSAPVRLRLGRALYRAGDLTAAAAEFDAAIGIEPGSGEAHNNLGACLERLGRLEEAIVQYRETVRLLPGSADARTNLTRALSMKKNRGRD